MNVYCRGCRTEIDLNASNCPICLRPRDRSEMLEDAKRVREQEAAAKKRPWLVAGWLLGLTAAVAAGWTWRGPARDVVARVRAKAAGVMDSATDPKTYAPTPAPAAAPAPAPTAPAAPARAHAPSSVAVPAPAPAPYSTPASVPAPLPPVDWTLPSPTAGSYPNAVLLRGFAYDLVAARPVPHARLRFTDRMSGASTTVAADQNGYYETSVSLANSGLIPTAETPGYRREPLDEEDPPWHARKPARRAAAAAREPGEVLLTFTPRQEEAVFNFVLIPRRP